MVNAIEDIGQKVDEALSKIDTETDLFKETNNGEKSAFVICPVREVTDEEKEFIENYVRELELEGYKVHYPPRNTEQEGDPIGLRICSDNREGIVNSGEVHIYWNGKSTGSLFDYGMTFMASYFQDKKVYLMNREMVEKMRTDTKSFHNTLLELDKRSRGLQ